MLPGIVLHFGDGPPSSPASDPPLAERLATRIRAGGPLTFSAFMDAALYAPDGFYESGGSAGRRGDFLTSPEVGPLFGAVIARALDGWWDDLGRPDPYVVVDAGAGPGTLARSILRRAPRCARRCGSSWWSDRRRNERTIRPASRAAQTCPTEPM